MHAAAWGVSHSLRLKSFWRADLFNLRHERLELFRVPTDRNSSRTGRNTESFGSCWVSFSLQYLRTSRSPLRPKAPTIKLEPQPPTPYTGSKFLTAANIGDVWSLSASLRMLSSKGCRGTACSQVLTATSSHPFFLSFS